MLSARGTAPPTPMIVESGASPMSSFSFPARPSVPSTPATPFTPERLPHRRTQSAFKFPPDPVGDESLLGDRKPLSVDTNAVGQLNKKASRIDLQSPVDESDYEHVPPGQVISAQSLNGETPRSSVDFYSMSNSTTETLASEYDPRTPPRSRPPHNRRHSLLSMGNRPPDVLMMGYAHVMGSFTVDGSLIQSSIFDETKRKGVVGTQMGGGVVGIETNKSEGGFLGGFGWGSITGLLGSSQMSSMAEMKNMASEFTADDVLLRCTLTILRHEICSNIINTPINPFCGPSAGAWGKPVLRVHVHAAQGSSAVTQRQGYQDIVSPCDWDPETWKGSTAANGH
jgi:hypothetical protein